MTSSVTRKALPNKEHIDRTPVKIEGRYWCRVLPTDRIKLEDGTYDLDLTKTILHNSMFYIPVSVARGVGLS
jgi:hypothetical protein